LKYVDPMGLSNEETTYTIEEGNGYTKTITKTETSITELYPEYTVYKSRNRKIEVIKILDTPEGKKYANDRNRSENILRSLPSAVLSILGAVKGNLLVTVAGIIDGVVINVYEAATSGAPKYEAGDTIIMDTVETIIVSARGRNPASCGVSYTKEETITIIDRFGNIKTNRSCTNKYY
jgi:hypothetical protein